MTERLWLRTVPSSATMRCRSVRLFVPMRSTQGRHRDAVFGPDLPHVGGVGRGGDDPYGREEDFGAEQPVEKVALAHVEVHLLRHVVHVAEGVDVGETFLYFGADRARHGYWRMTFTPPSSVKAMIELGFPVGRPSKRGLTT